MELIKPIVKVGNSAGIILPKEWLNGMARVELIEKPINIEKELFEILSEFLKDIEGIYIVGSYGRGDETSNSDVDILVVTNKTNKRIEQGKYNLILISKDKLLETIHQNALPLLPMIIEAKTLLNESLLKSYSKIALTRKNLDFYFHSVESALNVCKESIKLDKLENKRVSESSLAYSLVLNLRSVYIINSIIKNKRWSTSGLQALINKIGGSLDIYKNYIEIKNNKKPQSEISIDIAEKLINYIEVNLGTHKRWARRKR
ncbi:hypothetical protein COU57_03870 [Candidatus Pacearchaeota archaeon CG10_big_fil_rev_8_21_14_0_10_32_14]|nr:MAG: hypothetical protein COU57_03870 [Candidatus Pacearchaeota archaeon CG10_big_fil_rev_8_21_14_0_10_32_14]